MNLSKTHLLLSCVLALTGATSTHQNNPLQKSGNETPVIPGSPDRSLMMSVNAMTANGKGEHRVKLRSSFRSDYRKRAKASVTSIKIIAYDVGDATGDKTIKVSGKSTTDLAIDERNQEPFRLSKGYSCGGIGPNVDGKELFLDEEIDLPSGRGYVIWSEWTIEKDDETREVLSSIPLVIAVE